MKAAGWVALAVVAGLVFIHAQQVEKDKAAAAQAQIGAQRDAQSNNNVQGIFSQVGGMLRNGTALVDTFTTAANKLGATAKSLNPSNPDSRVEEEDTSTDEES